MGHIVIKGRIPSKKNSTIAMARNGRVFHFPSNKYQTWNKEAKLQLIGQENIPIGTSLVLNFYLPDKRKTDLTNKAESIMDTLVDSGLLADDCCQVVPSLWLNYQGVDKENPRCEISW